MPLLTTIAAFILAYGGMLGYAKVGASAEAEGDRLGLSCMPDMPWPCPEPPEPPWPPCWPPHCPWPAGDQLAHEVPDYPGCPPGTCCDPERVATGCVPDPENGGCKPPILV